MSTIALHLPEKIPQWWIEALVEGLHNHQIWCWPKQIEDDSEVEFVITLKPEPNSLSGYSNLKAIFATSAGVDHFIDDETLPRDIPLCRLTNPELSARMSEYVILHVLRHHRQLDDYLLSQSKTEWSPRQQKAASDVSVGIMGLGSLGLDAARKLKTIGFEVRSWSKSEKSEPGMTSYYGQDQLESFLSGSEYLVCFLPLTSETNGILNRDTLDKLPDGAVVVNVGRGACIVEHDLVTALDSGKVGAAVLDVFSVEPLPDDHVFWGHPKVTVTPHISTVTHPRMLGPLVDENIVRIKAGRPPLNVVDRAKGY